MSKSIATTPELNHIYAFKTILNFTTSLKDYFGGKNKSLALYHRLLSKTSFDEDDVIKDRIEPFKEFVVNNRSAILNQSVASFSSPKITLTDNVFIDMEYIFKAVKKDGDKDAEKIIWNHLLAISAILDPTANAKEFLKKSLNTADSSNEGNFLNTMMNTIEQTFQTQGVDAGDNPMALFQSIIGSDLIGNMMSSMNTNVENGNIDLGKLMGSMGQMMGSLQQEMGSGEGGQIDMMGMIASLTSQMGAPPSRQPPPQEQPLLLEECAEDIID